MDDQDLTTALRANVAAALNATPGYFAGPLTGPLMEHLAPIVLQRSNVVLTEVAEATRAALTATGFDPEPIIGPLFDAIQSLLDEVEPTQSSVDTAPRSAARVEIDGDSGTTRYFVTHPSARFGPYDDRATAEHVADNPETYLNSDRSGFLVELWIDGSGWNEGYDMVQQPVFVAYVETATDADDVMQAIERAPHRHAWTAFETRMRVAPATAWQRPPGDIINTWSAWIAGPGPESFIP